MQLATYASRRPDQLFYRLNHSRESRAVEIPCKTCPTGPISLRISKIHVFQFTCPGTRSISRLYLLVHGQAIKVGNSTALEYPLIVSGQRSNVRLLKKKMQADPSLI